LFFKLDFLRVNSIEFATMSNEKAQTEHVDAIESAESSDRNVPLHPVNSANEEIVQHLQTTGEEVGMTFRTIMAAIVSIPIRVGIKR
jgi:hypothetical protein